MKWYKPDLSVHHGKTILHWAQGSTCSLQLPYTINPRSDTALQYNPWTVQAATVFLGFKFFEKKGRPKS
jgi:hypothetical protein